MQKNRLFIQYTGVQYCMLFGILSLWSVSSLVDAGLYKWKDADNNTHYTEKAPTDGSVVEEVELPASVHIDTKEAIKSLEALQKKGEALSKVREKDQAEQKKQKERLALEKENCKKAKAKLRNVQSRGRVRAVDEAGNVVRVDEEERQRRISDAQDKIEKWCV